MPEAISRAWPLHWRPSLLVLGVIVVVVGLLLGAALIVERHLKSTVEHALGIRMARPVRIEGDFAAHLLSMHPSVSAREVSVDNPPALGLAAAGTASPPHRKPPAACSRSWSGTGRCRRCRSAGWRSSRRE